MAGRSNSPCFRQHDYRLSWLSKERGASSGAPICFKEEILHSGFNLTRPRYCLCKCGLIPLQLSEDATIPSRNVAGIVAFPGHVVTEYSHHQRIPPATGFGDCSAIPSYSPIFPENGNPIPKLFFNNPDTHAPNFQPSHTAPIASAGWKSSSTEDRSSSSYFTVRNPKLSTRSRKKHKCSFQGCTKAYLRREHLKRHQKRHDPDCNEFYECKICIRNHDKSVKVAYRLDNFIGHVKRHCEPDTPTSRTKFDPLAFAYLQSLRTLQRPKRKDSRNISLQETGWAHDSAGVTVLW